MQLKPGLWPTIRQLKRAPVLDRGPAMGNDGPVSGHRGACNRNRPLSLRAPGLKKFNLERQYWKNHAFNTEWNFQSRLKISFRAPLWPQKNRAWDWNFQSRMKISNREWKFQARMNISCVGGMVSSCVRARMNFFDPRAFWASIAQNPFYLPWSTKPRESFKVIFNHKR